jgi:hypothetical protein
MCLESSLPGSQNLIPHKVSHLSPSHWNDLYLDMAPQIPLYPRVHHLQELDNHPHRIRGGSIVRWNRH